MSYAVKGLVSYAVTGLMRVVKRFRSLKMVRLVCEWCLSVMFVTNAYSFISRLDKPWQNVCQDVF